MTGYQILLPDSSDLGFFTAAEVHAAWTQALDEYEFVTIKQVSLNFELSVDGIPLPMVYPTTGAALGDAESYLHQRRAITIKPVVS